MLNTQRGIRRGTARRYVDRDQDRRHRIVREHITTSAVIRTPSNPAGTVAQRVPTAAFESGEAPAARVAHPGNQSTGGRSSSFDRDLPSVIAAGGSPAMPARPRAQAIACCAVCVTPSVPYSNPSKPTPKPDTSAVQAVTAGRVEAIPTIGTCAVPTPPSTTRATFCPTNPSTVTTINSSGKIAVNPCQARLTTSGLLSRGGADRSTEGLQ